MRNRFIALATIVALLAGLVIGVSGASQFAGLLPASAEPGASAADHQTVRFIESSKNVFRVYGPDVYSTAVAVSQLVYPGPHTDAHPDAQPGVVILVPSGEGAEPFYAEALAAAALVHHPRNGPILFTDPERLNADTEAELRRLNPTGGDDWPQVLIVGRVSEAVQDEVEGMGLRVERLAGADQYETAALIDEHIGRPGNLLIVRGDDPSHGLPAVSWIAHMHDSALLFVERDRLPDATLRALTERQGPFAVRILGPEGYISAEVEEQLHDLPGAPTVTRIAGDDPHETAVAFASFREGMFGWGIESAGHGFNFATPERWQNALAGALTAHLGGHGPLLFTTAEGLPAATRDYLESVRPMFPADDPTQTAQNRGYLVVSPDVVSFDQQAEIDWLLESMPEMAEDMPHMEGDAAGHGQH